jgi:formate/nitrite transporter FocA (FNT family)
VYTFGKAGGPSEMKMWKMFTLALPLHASTVTAAVPWKQRSTTAKVSLSLFLLVFYFNISGKKVKFWLLCVMDYSRQ